VTEEVVLRMISAGGTPLLIGIGWVLWKLHLKLVSFSERLVRIETLLDNHLKHLIEEKEAK